MVQDGDAGVARRVEHAGALQLVGAHVDDAGLGQDRIDRHRHGELLDPVGGAERAVRGLDRDQLRGHCIL